MITCEHCGEVFQRRPRGPVARFCTDRCRVAFHRPRYMEDGRQATWAQTSRDRSRKVPTARPCKVCGTSFKSTNPLACMCSDECRRVDYNHRANAIGNERRAKMRGAQAERFTRTEIFERDNYTCHMCGRVTDPDADRYDPLKTTLDHVVPLAKGGTHTRDNVRCACRQCNVRAGAKLKEVTYAGTSS